jgi:hypothetical protein
MSRKFPSGADLVNNQIHNVADASAATDAVTLQQLQAMVRGLSWKQEVRAASTANVTVTAPGTSIDGVTLAANDRVLLKNQTTATENGIYTFNTSATALTRATDAATGANLVNATAFVSEGTTNHDTAWVVTTDAPITIGTTSLTWAQFGGGAAAYTAGNGLSLTSNVFAVVAGSGILADGTSTRVDPAVVTRKYAQDFGDGSTTSYAITHSLATLDVEVVVYDKATGVREEPDITHTSTSVVTIGYTTAPSTNAKRVVVQG